MEHSGVSTGSLHRPKTGEQLAQIRMGVEAGGNDAPQRLSPCEPALRSCAGCCCGGRLRLGAQDQHEAATNAPIYAPYPPGLLPADLKAEIDRVSREVDQIFQDALANWRALPPPQLAGNLQIMQGSGSDYVEVGQARALRQEPLRQQKSGLQFLSYALHWFYRTDFLGDCDDCFVPRLCALPILGPEADGLHLFTLLPAAALQ
jgi:hypothetical protein